MPDGPAAEKLLEVERLCPIGPFRARERDAVRRDLHPLLHKFLEVGSDGLLAVRSPWGYWLPLVDVALANAECSRRNALMHEALGDGDVRQALIHVERPYRLNMLEVARRGLGLSDGQMREGLAFAWTTLELVHPVASEGLRLLKRAGFVTDAGDTEGHDEPSASRIVVSGRRPAWLAEATSEVTVYRGASSPAHLGPCWTRDRVVAEWYARRFPVGTPTLFTGLVPAADVMAYFKESGEQTVIVDPARVRVSSTERLGTLQ
jgi:hypothetical protein